MKAMPMGTTKSLTDKLETALGVAAAAVLFTMMLITTVDVIGRYLFNKPLAGGFELTEMMLAALIYCGLPLVSKRREHIVIDTFDTFMSPSVKRVLDVAADVVCFLTLSGIGYLIFRRAVRVAEYGDTTSVLKLPLAPVAYAMGTMIVIAALIHLVLIFVPHRADEGKTII
jgi:TRAP-type C4-dicarboxylate transport system permease small subunit